MGKLRILIVDDHEIVRKGTRALLETQYDLEIVAEAGSGKECLQQARKWKPGLVILDPGMADVGGADIVVKLGKILPKPNVLVLTMDDRGETASAAIAAGAGGVVLKSDAASDLFTAIASVNAGKPFVSTRLTKSILGTLGARPPTELAHTHLTPREGEILRLLAEGRSSKEVGGELGISPRTVDAHRATIMNKLGVHSLGELIHYAIRNKIVKV